MSEMPVVSQIQHYQKSIEKCADNESRVLHCIQKLYRLPVTVQHLQETGVGRTVNALRKYDGTVGDAAKALVAKWKTMVVDEESSECDDDDETCIPDVPEGYSDNSDSGMDKESNSQGSSRHRSHESHERSNRNSARHDSSRHNSKQSSSSSSTAATTTTNSQSKSSVTKAVPESSTDQSKNLKSSSEKSESRDNHDSRSEKKSKSSRDSKSDRQNSKKNESHNFSSKSNKLDGHKGESSNRVSSTTGTNKEINGSGAHRKRKREVSASDKIIDKRRRNSTVEDDDDDDGDEDDGDVDGDNNDYDNDDEVEDKFFPDTSVQSDIECDARIKVKSEPSDTLSMSNRASTSKDATKREKSSKDKYGDSGNKLKDDKHRHSSDKHKSKSESKSQHRRSEKRKDDARNSTKSNTNLNSHSSKDRDEHKDSSEKIKEKKPCESKDKSKNQEHKDKKKKKLKYNGHDGIDCNSGTSFAEALGMCMAPAVNKKKIPSSPSLPVTKSIKVEPGMSSSSSSSLLTSPVKPIRVKTETVSTKDDQPLSLLAPNVKLEPLSVDLASTLPEISPNYKPLPTNYMNPIHRRQEEDKALNEAIYAKNMRTKVYSGNKTTYTSVPSLYELCIRVLIDNIEALEATGGVPYYIIKPVLERATADQLFMIEHYNPYLIEDTDDMWKFHCNREFRTKQREEMESWREMYMRCLDEREAKLKTLTANIKQSIDKSLPARSTKMAYVDNIVKPPRNVLRKQAKYGTSNTATSSSDLKKKILTGGTNAPSNISVPPPPTSRIKSSTSGVIKKSKAPLMAKALQLIKGRYKR